VTSVVSFRTETSFSYSAEMVLFGRDYCDSSYNEELSIAYSAIYTFELFIAVEFVFI
jgi:hypothetical protein